MHVMCVDLCSMTIVYFSIYYQEPEEQQNHISSGPGFAWFKGTDIFVRRIYFLFSYLIVNYT